MTQANKFVSNIIKKYNENDNVDDEYIKELIKYHPTKPLLFDDLEWLKMKKRSPFNTLALMFKRKGYNDEDDISWKFCIRNYYGKYNKIKTKIEDIHNAFRTHSYFGTMELFRIKNCYNIDSKCFICNIQENLSVDHYPIPYIEILNKFIEKNDIDLNNIEIYEDEGDKMIKLKNKELINKWLHFHDEKSHYRVLCKKCNSSMGAYKNKKE